jgi:glutamate/tyrosine decarboxylase-like PLP-dependent enzyme
VNPTDLKDLLNAAAERAVRYLEGLSQRRVAPAPEVVERLKELDRPLPAEPTDPQRVLAELDELGSPATVASAGGRFFGFVVGGTVPAALAANWLAGAWDQCAGLVALSPASAALEEIALGWLVGLFGLPASTGGALVTGATMANFSALAAARHALLAQAG